MAVVVVDTNVLGIDRPLENADMRRLLDEHKRGNLRLVVPQIVIDEAVNKWAEKIADEESKRATAVGQLKSRGALPADHQDQALDADALRTEEMNRVLSALGDAGVDIAPYPDIDHQQVVARALRREQPFDREG